MLVASRWFDYDRTMKDGPNIVGIAALIGDHARAEILTALMGGHALTATELAQIAGVTKQTVSAHLARLRDPPSPIPLPWHQIRIVRDHPVNAQLLEVVPHLGGDVGISGHR